MKIWPFNTEKRGVSYKSQGEALQRVSGTVTTRATATAACEAAAGVVSRAFASATVSGPPAFTTALTPACMALIGRQLIRTGEVVFAIDVEDGAVVLSPASDYYIDGRNNQASWIYRIDLAGPTDYVSRYPLSPGGVLHCKYLVDPRRPWQGISPITSAFLAGRLSAETSRMLGDLSSGPRGSVMPLPAKDGNDPGLSTLKNDLKEMTGNMALVESMSAGWGSSDARAGSEDWGQKHIQAEPPASLVTLNKQSFVELLAACGLSGLLFDEKAPGTSVREAWRQALHGCIQPIADIILPELQAKLHPDISISFDRLMASDIQGRARGFQSMVNGGMDVSKAAALSGLLMQDDSAGL